MLVLARKPNESILIGQNVEVFVVSISRNKVRLGIRAPEHIEVRRSEVANQDGRSTPFDADAAIAAGAVQQPEQQQKSA